MAEACGRGHRAKSRRGDRWRHRLVTCCIIVRATYRGVPQARTVPFVSSSPFIPVAASANLS